jgi:hypothetical protein
MHFSDDFRFKPHTKERYSLNPQVVIIHVYGVMVLSITTPRGYRRG